MRNSKAIMSSINHWEPTLVDHKLVIFLTDRPNDAPKNGDFNFLLFHLERIYILKSHFLLLTYNLSCIFLSELV